jgi:hypothetical protein
MNTKTHAVIQQMSHFAKSYPNLRLSTTRHCYTVTFEDLVNQEGDFTQDVARKLLRRLGSHRRAAEYDGQASDESLYQVQLQLSEKNDKIKRLEEELQDTNAWGGGFGRRKGR